jgi:hypothetical protein
MRVHVRTLTPIFVRRRQPQANLVLEHMRRWIDLDVDGPPQGNPHCRTVGRRVSLGMVSFSDGYRRAGDEARIDFRGPR